MLKRGRLYAASLAVLTSTGIAGIVFAQTTNEQGTKMGVVAVQITVKSYDQWRPIFDRAKPLRDKAGITNARVYRDTANQNEVLVWNETSDVAKAREEITGPEIGSAMQEAGVVGPLRVHVIP